MVSERREAVDSALRVHNYCVDCEETGKWIADKTKVVESTKDLGRDLAGVIAIQRKLSGLERDVAAIQARLGTLERESQQLMASHPELKEDIEQRQAYVEELWQGLMQALKSQEASLGEASQLQAFLQDLDAFRPGYPRPRRMWPPRTCPSPSRRLSSSCSSMRPSRTTSTGTRKATRKSWCPGRR